MALLRKLQSKLYYNLTCKIRDKGLGNRIVLQDNALIRNSEIQFSGNNNILIIEDGEYLIKELGLDIEGDNQKVVIKKVSDNHEWKLIAVSPECYIEIRDGYWVRKDYDDLEKLPDVILV